MLESLSILHSNSDLSDQPEGPTYLALFSTAARLHPRTRTRPHAASRTPARPQLTPKRFKVGQQKLLSSGGARTRVQPKPYQPIPSTHDAWIPNPPYGPNNGPKAQKAEGACNSRQVREQSAKNPRRRAC